MGASRRVLRRLISPLSSRHWQDLGYLILYITGRPDMQQQKVVAWLAQHNFPHGLVSFADGLSTDPLGHKADYLRTIIQVLSAPRCHGDRSCCEGVLTESLSLSPAGGGGVRGGRVRQREGHRRVHQPRSHAGEDLHRREGQQEAGPARPGRPKTGGPAASSLVPCSPLTTRLLQVLADGYAAHLAQLSTLGNSRPARVSPQMAIPKGFFGLPGQTNALRRRR